MDLKNKKGGRMQSTLFGIKVNRINKKKKNRFILFYNYHQF